MTIYVTRTDTDTYHHLVTEDFHILQQVRIQPRPCRCMVREEEGDWRWISQEEAQEILSRWTALSQRRAA